MQGQPNSQFWGKLRRNDDGNVVEWHPLVDHCADVAACCEALLAQENIRHRLARLAGLKELSRVQCSRLSALAALHDLGKFNFGFQAKALLQAKRVAGHVSEGLSILEPSEAWRPRVVAALGWERFASWGEEQTVQLLKAAICHHGHPPPKDRRTFDAALWNGANDALAGIHHLARKAEEWFPAAFAKSEAPLPTNPEFTHAFAGLVMLADWLGSDVRAFHYSAPEDGDRMVISRARACELLPLVGLDGRAARKHLSAGWSFSSVFQRPPREMQAALLRVPIPSRGSVTVLEAETGSGKTEAALARYLQLAEAGAVGGLYFALPTRTAATQIFERTTRAARSALGEAAPAVLLAVPGYLRADDAIGERKLESFEVLWNDEPSERERWRRWASENAKRYLAGQIVVGTIDQVLLSCLRVSHAHLRATSLLRSLLVVDEVHASDPYMTRLLVEVLSHHVAAGGHALLMSATLGAETCARLVQPGAIPAPVSLDAARAVPYPAIRTCEEGRDETLAIAHRATDKNVAVDLAGCIDNPQEVAARAGQAARAGARVLVLRNTVADCVATQQALEQCLGPELLFNCRGVLTVHHARFAPEDRRLLDSEVQNAFGEHSPSRGIVAAATQTVQQSLDLDADLLITDLCPIDVLLQRIGRLHRHVRRDRPSHVAGPRVVVLVPADRDLSQLIARGGRARGRHGFGTVYEDLRVLEATWWRLEESRDGLRIPSMNRSLVESAVHSSALARVVGAEARWMEHDQYVRGLTFARQGAASVSCVDWRQPYADQPFAGAGDERAQTRLGEGDRRVELPHETKGPFGVAIRALNLPAWLARGVPAEAEVSMTPGDVGVVSFRLGEQTFVYDRYGIRATQIEKPEEDLSDA